MAKLWQARPRSCAEYAIEDCCALFALFRSELAPYVLIVSLLCPFCVLEYVDSVFGKERAMMLTEHNKMTVGHARLNCGKVGYCSEL